MTVSILLSRTKASRLQHELKAPKEFAEFISVIFFISDSAFHSDAEDILALLFLD